MVFSLFTNMQVWICCGFCLMHLRFYCGSFNVVKNFYCNVTVMHVQFYCGSVNVIILIVMLHGKFNFFGTCLTVFYLTVLL